MSTTFTIKRTLDGCIHLYNSRAHYFISNNIVTIVKPIKEGTRFVDMECKRFRVQDGFSFMRFMKAICK